MEVIVKTLANLDIMLARQTDSNCGQTVILACSIQASQANRLNTDTSIQIPSKLEYWYVEASTKRCESRIERDSKHL